MTIRSDRLSRRLHPRGASIGVHAVAPEDVLPDVVAVGVPARAARTRRAGQARLHRTQGVG